MTGVEHFAEAESLVAKSNVVSMDDGHAQLVVAQAQVHATLALADAVRHAPDVGKRVAQAVNKGVRTGQRREQS